jgi:hypothetical protein
MIEARPLGTVKDLMRVMGLTKSSAYRLIERAPFGVRYGRRGWRVDWDKFDEWKASGGDVAWENPSVRPRQPPPTRGHAACQRAFQSRRKTTTEFQLRIVGVTSTKPGFGRVFSLDADWHSYAP